MTFMTASKCAWRAIYVYRGSRHAVGEKLMYVGLDPNLSGGPVIFGAIGRKEFKLRLPFVSWRYPMGRVRLVVYKLQQRFLHGLDGRYGWWKN